MIVLSSSVPPTPVGRPERAVPRIPQHVDTGADERGGAGVRLAGRPPQPPGPVEAQVPGGRRGHLLGDRLPLATTGPGTPDAAVGRARVHIALVVGRQPGDPAGHVAGAARGVALDVAVPRIVGVVRQVGDLLPAPGGPGKRLLFRPRRRVRPGRDDAGCAARLGVLVGLLGDLLGILTLVVVERPDLLGPLLGEPLMTLIRLRPGPAAATGRGDRQARGDDQREGGRGRQEQPSGMEYSSSRRHCHPPTVRRSSTPVMFIAAYRIGNRDRRLIVEQ